MVLPLRVRQAEDPRQGVHVPQVYGVHEVLVGPVLLLPLLLCAGRLVAEQLVPFHPVVGVHHQQLVQERAGLRCHQPPIEAVELPAYYVAVQVRVVGRVERGYSEQHLIQDCPDRVDVRPIVILLVAEDFRRHVKRRPSERMPRVLCQHLGQAEVPDLHVAIFEEDVGWLEISMYELGPNNRPEAFNDLVEVVQRLLFLEPPFLGDVLGQVAALAVFHDQVEVIRGFLDVVELYYVVAVEVLQRRDLLAQVGQLVG